MQLRVKFVVGSLLLLRALIIVGGPWNFPLNALPSVGSEDGHVVSVVGC